MKSIYSLFTVAIVGSLFYDAECYGLGGGRPGHGTGGELNFFRGRFGWNGKQVNVENFFTIPRTVREARALGYVPTPSSNDHGFDLSMFCLPNNVGVCPLFDKNGYIAGIQFAIPANDLINLKHYITRKMKQENIGGASYFTSRYYVVSPDTIRRGGRRELRDTVEDLWVEDGSALVNIPLRERDLAGQTSYRKQNCFPNMGTHYHYNMTEQMDCLEFRQFVPLVKNGRVIGLAFQTFGSTTEQGPRKWFESTVSSSGVEFVIPFAPPCFAEWTDRYHFLTFHMYFLDEPWNIVCENKDSIQPLSPADQKVLDSLVKSNS